MASLVAGEQAASQQWAQEQVILAPEERREAVLGLIRSARERLLLSVFRFTDSRVLDALGEALARKVRVELLLTQRAKGRKKPLKELRAVLERMGAAVDRYSGRGVKYHAKYMVADDGPALVTSLNLTPKCLERTCDFVLVTPDRQVVRGLKRLFEADCYEPEAPFPEGLGERLIVAPERARGRLAALLRKARHRIRIMDHKLEDPAMLALLNSQQAAGVAVEVLGRGALGALLSHGKMVLVDDDTAVIGSISLSPASLDSRREVAVVVRDPRCVAQLQEFWERFAAPGSAGLWPATALRPLEAGGTPALPAKDWPS